MSHFSSEFQLRKRNPNMPNCNFSLSTKNLYLFTEKIHHMGHGRGFIQMSILIHKPYQVKT